MNAIFAGYWTLEQTKQCPIPITNSDAQAEPDAAPTAVVYDKDGSVVQTLAATEMGQTAITDATNASPIVITSAGHGLLDGMRVTVEDVEGNTAANGDFEVANKTTNTFELSGSSGNGAYTANGTWRLTGGWQIQIAATAANGYEKGQTYTMIVNFEISSTAKVLIVTFTVQ